MVRNPDLDMGEQLVEIKQDIRGFDTFIGVWVCQDNLNLVVDVGPANTSGRLVDALADLGIERLDYVLLTHIHIDHAGGLADLLERYPMAMVICHKKAVEFLVDPSRLWDASRKVLGNIAEAYGQPLPVSRERLIPHTESTLEDLIIIETPGHALHHLSFSYRDRLFAGEAGGNYLLLGEAEYLRPATPPKFFLDVCLRSVDLLQALENQPIYYAHFGKGKSSHRLLRICRDQLLHWKEMIHEQMAGGAEDILARSIETVMEKDPNLRAFPRMDADTQERERFFITNSVKGFLGFLGDNP